MPPGNNNAKPTRRGDCTYCRRASCKGDNCQFSGFERVCGNTNEPQLHYIHQPAVVRVTDERSTFRTSGTSQVSSIGKVLDGGKVVTTSITPQPGSAALESNLGATRSPVVHREQPYPTTGTIREVVTAAKVPQPGSSFYRSTVTASAGPTAVSHDKPHATATSKVSAEIKIQKGNAPDNGTEKSYTTSSGYYAAPSQSELASNVSKPHREIKTYTSHSHLWNSGLALSEQGIQKNVNGTVNLTNSTKAVVSNESVFPYMKREKTATIVSSLPVTENKLLNNKDNTLMYQCASSDWEKDVTKVELDKNGIKSSQSSNFKADDGIKLPISKPSSCASIISKNSCNSDVVDKTSAKRPKSHHSRNALKYEGVVYQILNSRNAKVRVGERNGIPLQKSEWGAADAVHKFALVVVDKILQDDNQLFYPSNTTISSILTKGDVIILICTAHNNPSSGFQLFAHEARLTGQKSKLNNDADSVASYCSQTGSETQGSTSSKRNRRRLRNKTVQKMEVLNGNSCNVSDVVSNWLDTNEYSENRNDASKTLKLIAGCHYIGKVIEMRLPFAFIIEISSSDGKQSVFVFSSHFHPQGINQPAVTSGVSLESFVNLGDELVVIPTKNMAMEDHQYEWVASKAWPKKVQPITSNDLYCSSKSEQLIGPVGILNLQGDKFVEKADQKEEVPLAFFKSLYPLAKNWKEFDGVILSLQYDWGLIQEAVGSRSAYVFTRENAYLFGLSLQHFILGDVLKEGQLVKFSMETEGIEAMNAIAVWYENRLPNFDAFDIAAVKYCEERKIKFSTEESLIQHGKSMYFGQ